MEDNHQRRHEVAMIGMIRTYGLIMKILEDLPLPIRLPALGDSIYAVEVEEGLTQAWKALQDVPMDEEVQFWVGVLVLDWLIGREWMFADEETEAEWHLVIVAMQLSRILAGSDLVTERLRSLEE